MIRNRSGSPKPPELKLEGQQRAGTSCGSPCQHILLEAGLSPMSAKGEVQLEALSRFLPALLVCNLAQHLNFPGRKCKIQHQHMRCPVTELTRTFPHCCCCLVTQSCLTFWACQAPLSMDFPKQVYWSGLPFTSPGYLLDSRIEPASPALQADSLPLSYLGSPHSVILVYKTHCKESFSSVHRHHTSFSIHLLT